MICFLKNVSSVNATSVDFYQIGTPEIYFGYNFRRDYIGNELTSLTPLGIYNFTINKQTKIEPNKPYLEGSWKTMPGISNY